MKPATVFLALIVLAVASPSTAAESSERKVETLAREILTADYRGDRQALRRASDKLQPLTRSGPSAGMAHYWRGFAYWRRAVNGFNDRIESSELQRDLGLGAEEFRLAREAAPDFHEAMIGEAGCEIGWISLTKPQPANLPEHLKKAKALLDEAKAKDPDNPRLLWLIGGALWNTPVAAGGSRAKAIEIYRRGLAQARSAPQKFPYWGEPELLMSLGWAGLNDAHPDVEAAQTYLQAALHLAPEWRYVREILLPQVVKKRLESKARPMTGKSVHVDVELELRQIEALRDKDVRASINKDFATLAGLFTDDAVVMPPGQGFQRQAERAKTMRQMAEAMATVEILDYKEVFEETQVFHDLDGNLMAIEWGKISGTSRDSSKPGTPPEASSYKVLRILKKAPDGEWRIHRSIYN